MSDLTPAQRVAAEDQTRAHIRKRISEAVDRFKAERGRHGDIGAVFRLADGWATSGDLSAADLADVAAGAIMRCAELADEIERLRLAVDTVREEAEEAPDLAVRNGFLNALGEFGVPDA